MEPKKSDPLDGVKCFSIGGRMVEQRIRCLGMTNEERRWRAQWLKDQVLSPLEPRDVPEYYKETTNIFRRLYKTPLFMLYNTLKGKMGPEKAWFVRHFIGKSILFLGGIYVAVYYLKYNTNDFILARPVELFRRRDPIYPGDPDYPNYHVKEPYEYYDLGFYSSVLCQKVEPPPPPPPPPSYRPPAECLVGEGLRDLEDQDDPDNPDSE